MNQHINTTSILEMIQAFPEQKAGFYSKKLGLHRVTIHNNLNVLVEHGYIEKIGKTPHGGGVSRNRRITKPSWLVG